MGVFYYLLNSLLVSYHDSISTSVMTIIGVSLPIAGPWMASRCSIWTLRSHVLQHLDNVDQLCPTDSGACCIQLHRMQLNA